MWQRIVSITEESWVTIWRTAFSVVVGEALDFACEILDTQGRVIATAWESMPTFNFALPNTVKAVLKRFPLESLEEGDVIITNDPWLCAGHLFDIAA
ncbi:MAG: hydantoinase B/oxoprolinase family protein, partial [Nitrospinota bacterium]|nr:hydantoinase B/oxoprolinase family protein [Nitrospinota bacterium]